MPSHNKLRRSLTPLVVGSCAWLVVPAQAFARTVIRFVHAVPGVGSATVTVNDGTGKQTIGSVRFGQVTPWRGIRTGSFRWSLSQRGKRLATGTATLGGGAYDLVVLDDPSGPALGIYRSQGGRPGTSRIRVIHAAPELGSPQLNLDTSVAVKSLSFSQATPYFTLRPGAHTLAATRPGDTTPLFAPTRTRLRPDAAYSAVVIGSLGQRIRVVTLVDRGAPLVRPARQSPSKPPSRPTRRGSAAAGPADAKGSRTVVIRSGDSLWSIARGLLPPSASQADVENKLHELWRRNAALIGTGDPNLIFPGQRLVV